MNRKQEKAMFAKKNSKNPKKQIFERLENRIPKSNERFIIPKSQKKPNKFLIKNDVKPSTFLYLTKADEGITVFNKDDMDSIQRLQKRIENKQPIDSPIMEVDLKKVQVNDHDGRHRALAAMLEGIKKLEIEQAALHCNNSKCESIPIKDLSKEELSKLKNVEALKPQADKNFDLVPV